MCSMRLFQQTWKFEDYYDVIIVKHPILRAFHEKLERYPLLTRTFEEILEMNILNS